MAARKRRPLSELPGPALTLEGGLRELGEACRDYLNALEEWETTSSTAPSAITADAYDNLLLRAGVLVARSAHVHTLTYLTPPMAKGGPEGTAPAVDRPGERTP